jgi:elongation factor G
MSSPSPSSVSPLAAIRTLALVGPAAAGKTSLAEALLVKAGAIGAPGTLERGSTVSDFDPLERKMQHSLNAAVMHFKHAGTRVHFIDTPGSPDFLGQSLPALEAVETAAIVINAAVGIEPMAIRMMEYAASRHMDRLIVVNKIDAAETDLPGLLTQIQATFGKECLPINLPDAGATKVVDCFFNREGHSDFGSVDAAHRALVEQVVDVDEALLDRYLNDGDVDPTELHAPLEQALREGHLIPVCFVSARSGAGVAELLDIIVKQLPNPTEANPPDFLKGEGEAAVPIQAKPDPSLHVLAHVFKVTVDPFVGRMGIFRVHQGTVTKDSQLYIGDGRKPFKVGRLIMLQGKDTVEVSSAVPGDIVAVAKVDEIHFDAVLHDAAEDDHIHLKPLDFPKPVHGLAIEPKRHGDEQRMWEIMTKLVDEDPCLKVEHVANTNETIVYGLGELHLRVLMDRLRDGYKFEVNTRPPRIAYRETIAGKAEGHHRHKKQTGGAGQFGEVFLRIEPLAPRRRLRVPRSGQGWHHSLPVHPGRRKGRARGAGPGRGGRLPGGGRARHRLRRQAPQRGQQGNRLRHRRAQGLHGGHPRSAAHRAGAHRARRDHGAGLRHGRHHGRPVGQTWPGHRQCQWRTGRDDHSRPGADVRTVGLPEPAQCDDQRPGALQHRAEPLRSRAAQCPAAVDVAVQAAGRRVT